MAATATVSWEAGLAFQVEQDGYGFKLDAAAGPDGSSLGLRPKALLLSALGGCTAIDVVGILAKMRVPIEGLDVLVRAEVREEHPKVYTGIHVTYVFRGHDLPMEKLQRAVQLSEETYCGVSAMLRPAVPITSEIVVET